MLELTKPDGSHSTQPDKKQTKGEKRLIKIHIDRDRLSCRISRTIPHKPVIVLPCGHYPFEEEELKDQKARAEKNHEPFRCSHPQCSSIIREWKPDESTSGMRNLVLLQNPDLLKDYYFSFKTFEELLEKDPKRLAQLLKVHPDYQQLDKVVPEGIHQGCTTLMVLIASPNGKNIIQENPDLIQFITPQMFCGAMKSGVLSGSSPLLYLVCTKEGIQFLADNEALLKLITPEAFNQAVPEANVSAFFYLAVDEKGQKLLDANPFLLKFVSSETLHKTADQGKFKGKSAWDYLSKTPLASVFEKQPLSSPASSSNSVNPTADSSLRPITKLVQATPKSKMITLELPFEFMICQRTQKIFHHPILIRCSDHYKTAVEQELIPDMILESEQSEQTHLCPHCGKKLDFNQQAWPYILTELIHLALETDPTLLKEYYFSPRVVLDLVKYAPKKLELLLRYNPDYQKLDTISNGPVFKGYSILHILVLFHPDNGIEILQNSPHLLKTITTEMLTTETPKREDDPRSPHSLLFDLLDSLGTEGQTLLKTILSTSNAVTPKIFEAIDRREESGSHGGYFLHILVGSEIGFPILQEVPKFLTWMTQEYLELMAINKEFLGRNTFQILTAHSKGLIFLIENPFILKMVSPPTLNSPITTPTVKLACAFEQMVANSIGRKLLGLNPFLLEYVNAEGLNNLSQRTGTSALWWLTFTQTGCELLNDLLEIHSKRSSFDLTTLIHTKSFHAITNSENEVAGLSPFFCLSCTPYGQKILQKYPSLFQLVSLEDLKRKACFNETYSNQCPWDFLQNNPHLADYLKKQYPELDPTYSQTKTFAVRSSLFSETNQPQDASKLTSSSSTPSPS